MLKELLAAGVLAFAAGTVSAATMTLDFDGVGNDQAIGQNYGDVEGKVDVSYGSFDPSVLSRTGGVFGYPDGYGELTGVAYAPEFFTMEIIFTAFAGFGVSIFGFDIANFGSSESQTSVRVLDLLSGKELFATDSLVPNLDCDPDGVCSYASLDIKSDNGLRLLFGPDAFNVGIDNISYAATPIPLPASAWLLLAALGGIGAVARRKRTTAQVQHHHRFRRAGVSRRPF